MKTMPTNHAKDRLISRLLRPVITVRIVACFAVLCVALLACKPDAGPSAVIHDDATGVYWVGRLNHHAITLSTHAPWDTVQLSMTPLDVHGTALPDDGSVVRYESLDSNRVSVTPDGLVRAKSPTGGASVIARLTRDGLTYADTAFVQVVDNPAPPRLGVLSLQPVPPDSAKFSVTSFFMSVGSFLKITAVDGTDMSFNVLVYYRSEDPSIVPVSRESGEIDDFRASRQVGTTNVIATTYAYGVSRADTLAVTTGWPLESSITFLTRPRVDATTVETFPSKTDAIVGVGAEVQLFNTTENTLSLVFDDTAHIVVVRPRTPGESVNPTLSPTTNTSRREAWRRFDAPGIYTWRETRLGLVGRIHVIDERVSPTP